MPAPAVNHQGMLGNPRGFSYKVGEKCSLNFLFCRISSAASGKDDCKLTIFKLVRFLRIVRQRRSQ